MKNPIATIEMTNGSIFKIELYPEIAPNTVRNFISLSRSGFYDNTIFHRIVPGLVIMGGDPEGDGSGGPGYTIKGEFETNGHANDLSHNRGVISMCRGMDPDTAGSQFFIVICKSDKLDTQYAAFGKVIDNMDACDDIAMTQCQAGRPVEPQCIRTISIETFGETYEEPEKIYGKQMYVQK
jgi:peptidyl-prolyl cis-trans isomerase B (cyclophilin B)